MSDRSNDLVIVCPHCQCVIVLDSRQIRCGIFRHAVYKKTQKPIHPHTPQVDCERLIRQKKVYGCGMPFRITKEGRVEVCDWNT